MGLWEKERHSRGVLEKTSRMYLPATSSSPIGALLVATFPRPYFFRRSLKNNQRGIHNAVFCSFGELLPVCTAFLLSGRAWHTQPQATSCFQISKGRNRRTKLTNIQYNWEQKKFKEKFTATWCHLETVLHTNKLSAFTTERGCTTPTASHHAPYVLFVLFVALLESD